MEGQDGTLATPHPGVSSCPVCGSTECRQFHVAPWPDHYPFLPGGYDTTVAVPAPAEFRHDGRHYPTGSPIERGLAVELGLIPPDPVPEVEPVGRRRRKRLRWRS